MNFMGIMEEKEDFMNNLICSPTKLIFGTDAQHKIGAEVARYAKKVLLHYGGGSILRSGLYDEVVASLKEAGVEFVELGGAVPNPRLNLVYEGVELCKKEGVELVLAVGGGSAIDSGKAIALGACTDKDVWDFFRGRYRPEKALPVATVLTLPATGSETSQSAVITQEETQRKLGLNSDLIRPVVSAVNPTLRMTLPQEQVSNGICDILIHHDRALFHPDGKHGLYRRSDGSGDESRHGQRSEVEKDIGIMTLGQTWPWPAPSPTTD